MKEIRELIQSKLNEIMGLESGPPIPDNIIEAGKTYFGYEIQEDYQGSDMDKNYTMQVSIIGRIVRKDNTEENTLNIVDESAREIRKTLKELNFKCSVKDVSMDNGIRKMLVTGYTKYNEINNKFII